MKINELISQLQAISYGHGDVEVWLMDPDTTESWPMTAFESPTPFTKHLTLS